MDIRKERCNSCWFVLEIFIYMGNRVIVVECGLFDWHRFSFSLTISMWNIIHELIIYELYMKCSSTCNSILTTVSILTSPLSRAFASAPGWTCEGDHFLINKRYILEVNLIVTENCARSKELFRRFMLNIECAELIRRVDGKSWRLRETEISRKIEPSIIYRSLGQQTMNESFKSTRPSERVLNKDFRSGGEHCSIIVPGLFQLDSGAIGCRVILEKLVLIGEEVHGYGSDLWPYSESTWP